MVIKWIEKLITRFLADPYVYGINQFRDDFDDIIDLNRDALISEVGIKKYETLDEIYMALEMYEENEEIRKIESYCIDECQLLKKITMLFGSVKHEGG